jgi:predicted nucleic acid-binding protein
MKISLIVTDASPLITLAIANALDVLLMLKIRVIVPDMVKFEVTRHINKPGAQTILDWLFIHENREVSVGKTEEYEDFKSILKDRPNAKSRNRGEIAASEILAHELQHGVDAAILLFEDSDIQKANFLVRLPDNAIVMSTSSFLDGLQKKQLISSSDEILNRAVAMRGAEILRRTIFTPGNT